MELPANFMAVIILQYINVSNRHILYLKPTQRYMSTTHPNKAGGGGTYQSLENRKYCKYYKHTVNYLQDIYHLDGCHLKDIKTINLEFWCSRLRMWCCQYSSLGPCGAGSLPGLGNFKCQGHGQKKKHHKKKSNKLEIDLKYRK